MSNTVYAGIAVTSHHQDGIATATLDNLAVGPLTSVAWPDSKERIFLGGETPCPAYLQSLGGFKMLLAGNVADWMSVQSSSHLINWATLGTVTNTYGVVPLLDPQALTNAFRFYRAERVGP
ncbi:hypothetical protein SBV1_2670012 [Verrucomicrobia bacterium]|nr:hypothetical protein SBV1_2670012 [Verrucomicrobiota bacterium]